MIILHDIMQNKSKRKVRGKMDTTIIRPKREFPIKFNRKTILITIAIAVAVIGAAIMFISSDQNNHRYFDEQLEAAEELMIAKKYDQALECCDNAKGVFSNDDRVYIMEADIYLDKGDKEKAKKVRKPWRFRTYMQNLCNYKIIQTIILSRQIE